jgi:transposase
MPRQSIRQDDAKDRKIIALEAKIQLKNEVVAELLQEHVQLKKELGEL